MGCMDKAKQEHDTSKCYGRWYNRIPKCETCPQDIKTYCKDARNPRLLTDTGKETTVNFDDVAYSEKISGMVFFI
jgi:hypothetical protein